MARNVEAVVGAIAKRCTGVQFSVPNVPKYMHCTPVLYIATRAPPFRYYRYSSLVKHVNHRGPPFLIGLGKVIFHQR